MTQGRRPATPRLQTINPSEWAEHVYLMVRGYLAGLEIALPVSIEIDRSALCDQLAEFCTWAQQGGVGESRARAIEMLDQLKRALYRCPDSPPPTDDDPEPRFDERNLTGLVLAAATARLKVEDKEPVTVPQLGALSGFDRSRIRQFITSGRLRRTKVQQGAGRRQMDAPIVPSDARRLLEERGIAIA